MSFVVISSHESIEGKDLQQPGESIAVYATESPARERYRSRVDALTRRGGDAPAADSEGAITWVVLLKLPIPAEDIDEALETLEIIIEETDDIAGELGDLVVDYHGMHYTPSGASEYPRERAIENLHAWLS